MLGPVLAAPAVVAAVPARQGRHWLLARDLLPRRPDGVGLHRHAGNRPGQVRPGHARPRLAVFGPPPPGHAGRKRTAAWHSRSRAVSAVRPRRGEAPGAGDACSGVVGRPSASSVRTAGAGTEDDGAGLGCALPRGVPRFQARFHDGPITILGPVIVVSSWWVLVGQPQLVSRSRRRWPTWGYMWFLMVSASAAWLRSPMSRIPRSAERARSCCCS